MGRDMDENELNKKLAEWAFGEQGIELGKTFHGEQVIYRRTTCNELDKEWNIEVLQPLFTQSLDACFKWLAPKLEHYSLWSGVSRTMTPPTACNNAEVWIEHKYGYGDSKDSLALALCFAVEKLIAVEDAPRG